MTSRGVYSFRWGRSLYHLSSVLCLLGLALWLLHKAPASWFGLSVLLRAVLIGIGSFVARSGVFGRILMSGPTDRPLVALTFDDGPDPLTTPRVLDLLARYGAQATFFVIGERAAAQPALIARLVAAGHQVENHSQRHSWATAFGPVARLVADFSQAQQSIVDAGAAPPRFFRAPIGILSPPIIAAVQRLGLQLVGWSTKARDGWASTTVEAALARLEPALRPGAILLLHDGSEQRSNQVMTRPTIAPAVLEQLLPLLLKRGLRSVTLDELLD